jgi:glycosyltransferase involved in cell wall biosynthesis
MSALDASVCICTYNRKDSLLGVLRSLMAMQVPEDASFEVIVVDNNSSDGTGEALGAVDWKGLPLRQVLETRQGLSHARNRGVSEARGRVIAFLDDDVVVAVDWLDRLLSAFSTDDAPASVGGPAYLDADLPRPPWWHEELEGPAGHFDGGDSVLRSEDGYEGMIGIGANLAFDRRMFERYGLFRTDLGRSGRSLAMGEEIEFLERLRRNGERLVYDPSVVVHHRPDLARVSKAYLRRWYVRFGEWSFESERNRAVARVLGIPRWRFRYLLGEAGRWCRAVLTGRRGDAFVHQLHLVALGGYLKRVWSRPRRREPQEGGDPCPTE